MHSIARALLTVRSLYLRDAVAFCRFVTLADLSILSRQKRERFSIQLFCQALLNLTGKRDFTQVTTRDFKPIQVTLPAQRKKNERLWESLVDHLPFE